MEILEQFFKMYVFVISKSQTHTFEFGFPGISIDKVATELLIMVYKVFR